MSHARPDSLLPVTVAECGKWIEGKNTLLGTSMASPSIKICSTPQTCQPLLPFHPQLTCYFTGKWHGVQIPLCVRHRLSPLALIRIDIPSSVSTRNVYGALTEELRREELGVAKRSKEARTGASMSQKQSWRARRGRRPDLTQGGGFRGPQGQVWVSSLNSTMACSFSEGSTMECFPKYAWKE